MDQRSDCGSLAWRRPAQLMLLVASLIVVAAWLTWQVVPAKWNAPGYPSYVGYPKNVEHAALFFSGVAACLAALATARWKLSWWSIVPPVLAAFVVILRFGRPEAAILWPLLVAGQGLYFVWFSNREEAVVDDSKVSMRWQTAASIVLIYMIAGGICLAQTFSPAGLDLFHQGEVVVSARDWLAGGEPYRTMFWPHGMHDTWLAAQFMQATGNEGLGAVLLTRAATHLLGLCGLGLVLTFLLRKPVDAAWLTLTIAVVMPLMLYILGISFFAIVALLLLVRGRNNTSIVLVGALLGWAYLWRFETGVYALVAACTWLIFQEYHAARGRFRNQSQALARNATVSLANASGSSAGRFRRLAARACLLLVGVVSLFAATRLAIGLPTFTLLRTTLVELPRFHADNTGFPLPLPIRGFEQFTYGGYLPLRWLTFHFLLFAIALAAFLLEKAVRQKLAADSVANRFFLILVIYGLLNLKTGLDRVGPCHLFIPMVALSIPILFDAYGRLTARIQVSSLRISLGMAMVTVCFGLLPHLLGPVEAGLSPFSEQIAHACRSTVNPRPSLQSLHACLKPTQSWQDLLEPSQDDAKPIVVQGIRELRCLLSAHDIGPTQLIAVHSGPMIYPLLDHQCPTAYYLLGWAMNDDMERQAVNDLEANRVSAVLRLSGVGRTLPIYDVPDAHRVPRIDRFLQQQTTASLGYLTSLGTLWVPARGEVAGSEQGSSHPSHRTISTSDGRRIPVGSLEVGYVEQLRTEGNAWRLSGWTCAIAAGRPVDELLILVNGRCVARAAPYFPRPDVARVLGRPELVDVGFNLVLPHALIGSGHFNRIQVIAVSGDQAGELQRIAEAAYELAERP